MSKAESIMHELRRQFPVGVTTHSNCMSDSCDNSARGGGYCKDCLTTQLSEIVGEKPAQMYREQQEIIQAAIIRSQDIWHYISDIESDSIEVADRIHAELLR